jgi:rsbT co-antagonist protein RsbR
MTGNIKSTRLRRRQQAELFFLPITPAFHRAVEENIGYKVSYYQIEGNDHTYIEFFPAEKNIIENIHDFTRKREGRQIRNLETLVEEKTNQLQSLVKTLSSPMIPVLKGIVVVPLMGKYDEKRSAELIDKVLQGLPEHKARYLLLDLTGWLRISQIIRLQQ